METGVIEPRPERNARGQKTLRNPIGCVGTGLHTGAKVSLTLHPAEPDGGIRFVRQEDVYGKSYEDIRRRVPDNTRMRDILKVTVKVDLREGLRRTMGWFLEEAAAGGGRDRVVTADMARRATARPRKVAAAPRRG